MKTRVEAHSLVWIKPAPPELKIPSIDVFGPDGTGKLSLLFEEGAPVQLRDHVAALINERLQQSPPQSLLYVSTLARTELVRLVGEGRLQRQFHRGWEFRAETGEWFR